MAPCRAGELFGAVIMADRSAGSFHGRLVVYNAGEKCTLQGYSRLQLLGENGVELPTETQHEPGIEPRLVHLPVDGFAIVNLTWSSVISDDEPSEGPCQPNPHTLRVIMPNGAGHVDVPWPFGPVCRHGQIYITPYYAPASCKQTD